MEGYVNRRVSAPGALVPGAARVSGVAAPRFRGAPDADQAGRRPKLKTSLNAYSFTKPMNDQLKGRGKGMSLFDLLEFCAEHGLRRVDPTGYFFPGYPKVPGDKYLNDFKRRAFQLGVDISGTGVRNDFAAPTRRCEPPTSATSRSGSRSPRGWARRCSASSPAPRPRATLGPGGRLDGRRPGAMRRARREVRRPHRHPESRRHAQDGRRGPQAREDGRFHVVRRDRGHGLFLSPDPYEDIARVLPYAVNWQIKEKVGRGG